MKVRVVEHGVVFALFLCNNHLEIVLDAVIVNSDGMKVCEQSRVPCCEEKGEDTSNVN